MKNVILAVRRRFGCFLAMVLSAFVATNAQAYPDFGRNVDGQCMVCHSTIVNDRMELFDFTGIVDPAERAGVPDQGPLKYYTVEAGSSVSLNMRATNGEENYAFRILGFEDLDVTQGNELFFSPDNSWDEYAASNLTYYGKSDGAFDGYDWNTSDPTEVGFNIAVDAQTEPGYYLLNYALVGRDSNRDGWYHEELIYLEVTQGSNDLTLTVDGTCPGGGPIVISWENATPNRTVALIYARGTGNQRIPEGNPCAGTQLGLNASQIQVVFQGPSGANGNRTLNANAGGGACGGYLQLLDVQPCATSNVAQIQ